MPLPKSVAAQLETLPARAAQRAASHRKFFKKLKRRVPPNLDRLMMELHEAEFSRTDCLQCANCCKTTGPLFTSQDIDRLARLFRIKPGVFMETYLRQDEDGDWVLQELPCPFLGADNYCSVYEVRPKACREYPHTDRRKFHQISAITLKNTAVCPAAFNIVEAMMERLEQDKTRRPG